MNRIYPALGVAILAFALFCPSAHAQVAVTQGVGVAGQTVQIQGQFNTAPYSTLDVYTVPSGKRFRITDIMLTNYSSDYCDVCISGKTYEIRVAPNSTSTINLLSGPEFRPGQKVTLENTWRLPGHGTNCKPIYTIMGYLYTFK